MTGAPQGTHKQRSAECAATDGFSYAAVCCNELLRWCDGAHLIVGVVLLIAVLGLIDAAVQRGPLLLLIAVLCASVIGHAIDLVKMPRLISIVGVASVTVALLMSNVRQARSGRTPARRATPR